ncbi:MAG: hypothetical protein JWO30_4490 [Fibrobacteres bacterium]|nr:hypothetical protein [Fibrobacterota bacterium]
MIAFWEHLGSLEKAFWFIAILSSTVLFMQLILTFLGMDHGHDADAHHPGGGHFQIFTVRTFTAFFALFGWVGLASIHAHRSVPVTVALALAAGTAGMAVVASIFYGISRMTEDSTFKIADVVGAQGKVYIPVPGARNGSGKITVTRGALHELDAVTDGEKLPTGAMVRIKAVLDGSTLLVERL